MRKRIWKRSTFWVTVWAVLILTLIVVRTLGDTSMLPSAAGILQVVAGLCGTIVLAYVGGNQAIDHKHGPEQEPESKGE
jgi:hypothetical protein